MRVRGVDIGIEVGIAGLRLRLKFYCTILTIRPPPTTTTSGVYPFWRIQFASGHIVDWSKYSPNPGPPWFIGWLLILNSIFTLFSADAKVGGWVPTNHPTSHLHLHLTWPPLSPSTRRWWSSLRFV